MLQIQDTSKLLSYKIEKKNKWKEKVKVTIEEAKSKNITVNIKI